MKRLLYILLLIPGITTWAPAASMPGNTGTGPVSEALDIAHELDEGTFRGWTYGAYSAGRKQLDCTTFISAVMDTLLSRKGLDYTPEMRKELLIIHPRPGGRNVVREGPDPSDPRYAGAVYVIEKYGLGSRIKDMSQVKPGDVIQYWKRRSSGSWFGHAALIESVRHDGTDGKYKARIFGAHRSSGGIAVSAFELHLTGDDRLVYIARIP